MKKEEKFIELSRLYLKHASGKEDIALVILKGHLVLEKIVHEIILERLHNPNAIKAAKLSSFQAICLAESLCPEKKHRKIWLALKQVNNIRNDMAHKLEPKGAEKKIETLFSLWDSGVKSQSRENSLFMTLFSLVSILTLFLRDQRPDVIQLFE